MKSILLIALACLIQLSFSSSDVAKVTIKEDGIYDAYTVCFNDIPGSSILNFRIAVTTEGFTDPYEFTIPLNKPSYAFATCIVGPKKSETRSTSEEEYMICTIYTSMFPLYQTAVLLPKSYSGDGNFQLSNWEQVIGARNLIADYSLEGGCYDKYSITFQPSEDYVDSCSKEKGRHIVSILGKYNGDYKGAFYFVPSFLIEDGNYRKALCELREPTVAANSGELELS